MMQYGLRDWSLREPARPALQFEDGRIVTYGALEAMANRFAQFFRRSGLVRGDHVAGILANTEHVFAVAWGAYRAGVYYTPIANTLTSGEIAYLVENSQSRLVLADACFAPAVADLPGLVPGVRYGALGGPLDGFGDLEGELSSLPEAPLADETPGGLMMYSSGTTGVPKGIWRPLPDPAIVGDGPPLFARDLLRMFPLPPDTQYVSPAPLYHAAPLRWALAVLSVGGCVHVMRKFDAGRALDLIEQRGITHSQWVPAMFQRMLDLPEERRRRFSAPALKAALHAAAPCPPALKRAMLDWWGPILHEYYSGTESVGLTWITPEDWLRKPGSVGRAIKGEMRILAEDGSEQPVGAPGVIYFGGTPPFEYFCDPAKTATRTSPQGYQTCGDIGHVDAEGYLYLTDRLDDMIISGGVNVYPQEIERAIEAMDEVAECAVVGVVDAEFGERPVAFAVAGPGRSANEALVARIADHCRQSLGRTKQPREIRLVGELPRSATGKLLRLVLRETLAATDMRDAG